MRYRTAAKREMAFAMRWSLGIGFFMLVMKTYAYFITGSAAILSDAAESIVHVFAVGFAAYSLHLSFKPADKEHTYGHDRITFFSAGFEGALIIIAALYIIYEAFHKLIYGFQIENLDAGMTFVAIATLLNGILGLYLVRQGKKHHSLVLEADGKHILTDCFTSIGVILALILTKLTGWILFDPLIAILIGCNILWTGTRLIRNAVRGLMDETDPQIDSEVRKLLDEMTQSYQIHYHHLRHRNAGNRVLVEVHLLFPDHLSIAKAHEYATQIEQKVEKAFAQPIEMVSHLEPIEAHDEVHTKLLGRSG